MLLAGGLDRDVAQRVAAVERDQVDGADAPAGLADGGRDAAEHAGPVVDLHAQDDRVLRETEGMVVSISRHVVYNLMAMKDGELFERTAASSCGSSVRLSTRSRRSGTR